MLDPNPIVTYAEALLLDLEHLMATLDQIAHNQSTLKISELLSHGKCMYILKSYVERYNCLQQ